MLRQVLHWLDSHYLFCFFCFKRVVNNFSVNTFWAQNGRGVVWLWLTFLAFIWCRAHGTLHQVACNEVKSFKPLASSHIICLNILNKRSLFDHFFRVSARFTGFWSFFVFFLFVLFMFLGRLWFFRLLALRLFWAWPFFNSHIRFFRWFLFRLFNF